MKRTLIQNVAREQQSNKVTILHIVTPGSTDGNFLFYFQPVPVCISQYMAQYENLIKSREIVFTQNCDVILIRI